MTVEPTDDDFGKMHRALGRPSNAYSETYRNYFCANVDSDTAERFMALGFWEEVDVPKRGKQATFRVNEAGRDALAVWMIKKSLSQTSPFPDDSLSVKRMELREWQPIDSAPQDRPIILFSDAPNVHVTYGYFDPDYPSWVVIDCDGDEIWLANNASAKPPTHWMPLPAPPTT